MKRAIPPTPHFAASLLLAGCAIVLLARGWGSHATLRELAVAAGLATGAALAAHAGRSRPRPVRLALAFVLAALAVLPSPLGALVAVAALLAGRGAGVAGPARTGIVTAASVLAPICASSFLPGLDLAAPHPEIRIAAALVAAFLWIEAVALGIALLLRHEETDRPTFAGIRERLVGEAWNLPAALVIAVLIFRGDLLIAAAAAATVVFAARSARNAAKARADLRSSREALSNRLTELATIHSISREIVSSVDLARVFGALERECRKIFDVDFFFVALVDRQTRRLRVVYRRRGVEEPIRETVRPMGDSLASWVATAKRAALVDDFRKDPERLPFRPLVVDDEIRSAIAVPLLVENEVTGVLSVQSRRPSAYDQHLLSVLYTIGQQAAVAIENARHFEMATVDSLTGLFLRDYFFRRLEEEHGRAIRYRQGFVLLMADLDGFKEINDRYGHMAGDHFLHGVGVVIRDTLRSADLACRYGGDEFCLLLPQTDVQGARIIAERLRDALAALEVDADGLKLKTTVSIGLAAYPDHESQELKALLRKADQALYRAKRGGRDRVSFFAA